MAAPPSPPAPIDGALPAEAPHGLDRRAECVKEGCTLAHIVPDEVRPALSDGAPVVVWEQVIGERASVVFSRATRRWISPAWCSTGASI